MPTPRSTDRGRGSKSVNEANSSANRRAKLTFQAAVRTKAATEGATEGVSSTAMAGGLLEGRSGGGGWQEVGKRRAVRHPPTARPRHEQGGAPLSVCPAGRRTAPLETYRTINTNNTPPPVPALQSRASCKSAGGPVSATPQEKRPSAGRNNPQAKRRHVEARQAASSSGQRTSPLVNDRTVPDPPPPTPAPPTRVSAASAGGLTRATGQRNGSNAGRKTQHTAPKHEFTLFDHLLSKKMPARSSNERTIIGTPERQGDRGRVPPVQQKLQSPSKASGSGNRLGVGQRYTSAFDPSLQERGTPPKRFSKGSVQYIHSEGGCDGSQQSSRSFVKLARGYAKPIAGRAVTYEDVPKPGKQRLGPRKKKLSSLKKRILLDRAAKWRNQLAPAVECPSLEPKSETTRMVDGGTGGTCEKNNRSRGAVNTDAVSDDDKRKIAVIHNLVEEAEVEEGEEHAEAERDTLEMASASGVVHRMAPLSVGTMAVKVDYATPGGAERARESFQGRVVGGKALEIKAVRSTSSKMPLSLSKTTEKIDGGVGGTSPILWHVAINNLIHEDDDLEDDDEYAEICADAANVMGCFGNLLCVDVPRRRTEIDHRTITCEVVATFGSLAEAEACVSGIKGRLMGGTKLDAELIDPRKMPSAPGDPQEYEKGQTSTYPLAMNCRREDNGDSIGGSNTRQWSVEDAADEGFCDRTPKKPKLELQETGEAIHISGSNADAKGSKARAAAQSRNDDTTVNGWRVVVKNLIEEEDLEDDDNYDETCADFAAMTIAYGQASALFIPRDADMVRTAGIDKGEALAIFGSQKEAEACAQSLCGRMVSGKVLEAKVVSPLEHHQSGISHYIAPARTQSESYGTPLQHQPMRLPKAESLLNSRRPVWDTEHLESIAIGKLDGQGGRRGKTGATTSIMSGTVSQATSAGVWSATQHRKVEGTPTVLGQGKVMPNKYKEAAALPRPPAADGWGSKGYVNQARVS